MKLKGTRWFYEEDPRQLDNLDDLAEHLASLLNSGCYVADFRGEGPKLISAKARIAVIRRLGIEIYQGNTHHRTFMLSLMVFGRLLQSMTAD